PGPSRPVSRLRDLAASPSLWLASREPDGLLEGEARRRAPRPRPSNRSTAARDADVSRIRAAGGDLEGSLRFTRGVLAAGGCLALHDPPRRVEGAPLPPRAAGRPLDRHPHREPQPRRDRAPDRLL